MENVNEKINECLNCKTKPCQTGCPLKNDIPSIIKLAKENKIEQAYYELNKTTVLPSICGRICPHYKQCMGSCIKGIKGTPVCIGEIEAFIGDKAIENGWKINKKVDSTNINKKIAIIGSGPAGLTCAAYLAIKGFKVTIYEKHNELGGLLRHGIPNFRLDKRILDDSIQKIIELGIEVKFGQELGKNIDLNQLKNEYNAVCITIGANIPWKMQIPGEDLQGVYGGNTLLETKEYPDFNGKKVAIIGGGNVAIDCARTIKRLGAESVKIIYRRSKEQMPAEQKEIEQAENENIEFLYKNNIVKVIGNEKVEKIECIKTHLVQKQNEKRLCPINIENSNYIIDMDYVIMAIGAESESKLLEECKIELNQNGYIKVNEDYTTSEKNIFAAGDVCGAKATVAWAAYTGRKMAESVEKYTKS